MNKSKEVAGRLLVPRGDPMVLLQQADEPFDLLAFLVQLLVIIAGAFRFTFDGITASAPCGFAAAATASLS